MCFVNISDVDCTNFVKTLVMLSITTHLPLKVSSILFPVYTPRPKANVHALELNAGLLVGDACSSADHLSTQEKACVKQTLKLIA